MGRLCGGRLVTKRGRLCNVSTNRGGGTRGNDCNTGAKGGRFLERDKNEQAKRGIVNLETEERNRRY